MDDASVKVRIMLADDEALFREAVRAVFESQPDFEVVAEARNGQEAVGESERTRPDLVMVDAGLPNLDGFQATRRIRERSPHTRVLLLVGEEDEDTLLHAVEAGASGYLSKESPLADLIGAARAIHRGETLVPGRMLGPLLEVLLLRRRRHDDALRKMSRLTNREREVLWLLADGEDNDSIARTLVISPQTARTHIQNLLGKLGVHSRLEAAAFLAQNGLLRELAERSGPDDPGSGRRS